MMNNIAVTNTNRYFCPVCEEYRNTSVLEQTSIYKVKESPITVSERVRRCLTCGSGILDEELDSQNMRMAFDSYRAKNGLLQPKEIQRIRQKYGLSQRSFSRLLGWGDISLHRYESGAIQNKAHDSILRFVDKPSNLQQLFDMNKAQLPAYVSSNLQQVLNKLLAEETVSAFQASFENLISREGADPFSGYRSYDIDKFKNMIVYLTKKLDGVLITKLNKLLWYCDFLAFKETTVSVSGSRYYCHQYGPVPENYDLIVDVMTRDLPGSPKMLDKREVVFNARRGVIGEEFISVVEPDLSVFSALELRIFDHVCREFCDYTSSQIKERSHKENGFLKCEAGAFMPYEYAQDLSISLPKESGD